MRNPGSNEGYSEKAPIVVEVVPVVSIRPAVGIVDIPRPRPTL